MKSLRSALAPVVGIGFGVTLLLLLFRISKPNEMPDGKTSAHNVVDILAFMCECFQTACNIELLAYQECPSSSLNQACFSFGSRTVLLTVQDREIISRAAENKHEVKLLYTCQCSVVAGASGPSYNVGFFNEAEAMPLQSVIVERFATFLNAHISGKVAS